MRAFSLITALAMAGLSNGVVNAGSRLADAGGTCGGIAGLACGANEYCDFPDTSLCGQTDQTGICKPRPDTCLKVYMPVCGCDGMTYGNACEAAAGGVDVAYAGACRKSK